MTMTEIERHRIIHLVAARGYDVRTVAKVLDGVPSHKKLVHERIRLVLAELGVTLPSSEQGQRAA